LIPRTPKIPTLSNSDSLSVPVQDAAQGEKAVQPLDAKTYSALPPTMQKMTVMGKVIVVTG